MIEFKPRMMCCIPTPAGTTMAKYAGYIGSLLCLVGIGVYSIASYAAGELASITALVPAVIGAMLLATSIGDAIMPTKRAVFMHGAVVLGIICVLGGGMGVVSVVNGQMRLATFEQLFLLVIGLDLTSNCVRSFIHVRKQKSNGVRTPSVR